MAIDSFSVLLRAVIDSSASTTWNDAVHEWDVVEVQEDARGVGVCVCGQTGLVHLYTIRNRLTNARLYPIGSVCINKFGRADLDRQITLFADLHGLRKAIVEGRDVQLTKDFFSRAMLEYFAFSDIFTPDQWNFGNGEKDYEFLLKMFNKQNKESITRRQQSKIFMLLQHKVFPFVLADERLR